MTPKQPLNQPDLVTLHEPPNKEVTFDLARAVRFAKLGNLIYSPPTGIERRAAQPDLNYKVIAHFSTESMHAAIFANAYGFVVAFRGTNKYSRAERKRAFSDEQTDFLQDTRVHKGCRDALLLPVKEADDKPLQTCIEETLLNYLDQHSSALPKLYFTGHSIGGSLACLSACELLDKHSDLRVNSIYTFGQPRVGDPAFAKHISTHPRIERGYYRFAMARDPVPLFPKKYGTSNDKQSDEDSAKYKHGGRPIVIDSRSGKLFARSSTKAIEERLDERDGDDENQSFLKNVWDSPAHRISFYKTTLEDILNKQHPRGKGMSPR